MEHIPVLADTIIEILDLHKGNIVIDCTLGLGGHTRLFADSIGPSGKVIALETDRRNLHEAQTRLAAYTNISFHHTNFEHIEPVVQKEALHEKIDAILFDLGLSSPHIDDGERGFSFKKEARLDMRFDSSRGISALEVVNQLGEKELADILYQYGEEKQSRHIAKKIVDSRQHGRIETTSQLAGIIEKAVPRTKKDSLPKVFQAIRIYVNRELEVLQKAIQDAFQVLKPGGKLVIISYHSLEDRIVKQYFKELLQGCICPPSYPICICHKEPRARAITKKPIIPSDQEISTNPRSRSAKLRIIEKV